MRKVISHPAVKIAVSLLIIFAIVFSYYVYRWYKQRESGFNGRAFEVLPTIGNPERHPEWQLKAGLRCNNAPFSMPTDGFIGFIWGDSFRPGHQHQGLDIFGGPKPGVTPVYAAYSGYLSRLPDWKSTVIIRIPEDPLKSGRQIWTYYTHLATREGDSFIVDAFPPGTSEVYVEEGTLLGYQGNFSGDPFNPTGTHLHFSIVKDNGNGNFLNELEIKNTIDPSPYFGMRLNARENPDQVPICETIESNT
jgi:murein DD-endopeptidase MepM/ murein hydrolase activator NlpD